MLGQIVDFILAMVQFTASHSLIRWVLLELLAHADERVSTCIVILLFHLFSSSHELLFDLFLPSSMDDWYHSS